MFSVEQTEDFSVWLRALRDATARGSILRRIDRARLGNFGDCEAVGAGVREMRVHVGPGYRVYFVQRGERLILLLCGGDKSTQQRDIARARDLAKEQGR